jgi:type VI secretion system secreted protein VgrG
VKHDEDISIDNNRTEKVGVDETISIGNNRSEDVGVDEDISIGNSQSLQIGNNRSESVGRDERISIGGNRDYSLGSSESISYGKDSKLKVKKSHNLNIGGNHSLKVSKFSTETTLISQALSVGMGYQVTVGGIKNETVGISSNEQVGKIKHILVGNEFKVTVGESKLSMKRDGTIILKGGKALNLSAKNVVLKGATMLEFIDSAKKSGNCKLNPNCNPQNSPNPVNAILGVKVLGDEKEQDFNIKAPLALDWQREYASDNARVGMLGQGWSVPLEYELEIKKDAIILHYRHDTQIEFASIDKIEDESIITKRGFRLIRTKDKEYMLILDEGKQLLFKPYEEDKYKITAMSDKDGNRLNLMFDNRRDISYITTQDNRLFELEYRDMIQEEEKSKEEKSKEEKTKESKAETKSKTTKKAQKVVRRLKEVKEHIFKKTILTVADKAKGKKEEELLLTEDGKLLYLQFANKQLQAIASYPKVAKDEIEEKSKLQTQESQTQTLVTYNYSKQADLIEVKNKVGDVRRLFEYKNHIMIAHKQPEGLESFYEYDEYTPKGKVQKSWTSRGEEWNFEYEDKKTTTTNHLDEKDYFEYDEDNYLTLRGNDQEEMKFEYTDKGLLKKLTNQFDQTKELRYNDYGQPTLIKEFDGIITRIYYDTAILILKKISFKVHRIGVLLKI